VAVAGQLCRPLPLIGGESSLTTDHTDHTDHVRYGDGTLQMLKSTERCFFAEIIHAELAQTYTSVSQKSIPQRKKLFALFSLKLSIFP